MMMTQEEMVLELQDIFRTVREDDVEGVDGFYTTSELARSTSLKMVRQMLRAAKDAGRLEVRMLKRMNIIDQPRRVPAYKILDDPPTE